MGCVCGLAAWLVKYILFVANVLFMLSGLAILVLSSMAFAQFVDYNDLIQGQFTGISLTFIVIGSLIFLISFCGCCGAISENRCLLITYGSLLMVILLSIVGISIWALVSPDAIEYLSKEEMKKFFDEEYHDSKTSEFFDRLQTNLECCGVYGHDDYTAPMFPGLEVPESCCPEEVATCSKTDTYFNGCHKQLMDYIDGSVEAIGIVSISVSACVVFAMVFAFCLADHYKGKNNYA